MPRFPTIFLRPQPKIIREPSRLIDLSAGILRIKASEQNIRIRDFHKHCWQAE